MTLELLRQIPLFASLGPEDLNELLAHLQRKTYPAHTVIFWTDEPGDRLYVIEKGEVRITHPNQEGKERTLATLSEGDFFGELSLLDGGPHTATARTHTEAVILSITQAAFYSFLDKRPQFSRSLLAVLVDRLRNSTERMRSTNVHEITKPHETSRSVRHVVDRAARIVASGGFLIVVLIFLVGWIGVQTALYHHHHRAPVSFEDKPPTFFLLGFLLTLTSFLLTILVLTSQRRQAERDRLRAEIEYQVNLKAQAEIMRLQLKMDQVMALLQEKNEKETQA